MTFNPQCILKEVLRLSAGRRLCLAYSGGVDSHVLLHLLAGLPEQQRQSLRILHVDPGLNPNSASWAKHCQQTAQQLGLHCQVIQVAVTDIAELGLEAAARHARYQAFREQLTSDDCLLTAQHQQDQAETLLLQLLRGAGVRGLSAMQPVTDLSGLCVIRPLLSISRQAIVEYAKHHQLNWLEDPSNSDQSLNRNYLRQQIMPLLASRWPAVAATLSRSAEHQAEAQVLLDELAVADLRLAEVDWSTGSLSLPALQELTAKRQRNALRYFFHQLGLSTPSTVNLQRILDEVFNAATDANPLVHWQGVEVRRFQHRLFAMSPLLPLPAMTEPVSDTADIELSNDLTLHWQQQLGAGLSLQTLTSGLTLRYRQGGEKIRLSGHAHHHALKNLFQQWQVPPWQRDRIPLLFAGEELVAIADYGWSDIYAVQADEIGWIPVTQSLRQASFSLSDTANSGNL